MADVTATVRAVVAVVDKATAPLRAIQTQFKAFGSGLSGMGARLKALGDAAPIQRIGSALKNVGSAARGVFGNLTRIVAPLAALAGAAGIGGLSAAINRFANEGERLQNLSAATGETVQHLQELEHWADISGVSVEALHKAMARTNKTAGEAATGKNKKAAKAFADLGISIKDSAGHVRTFGEIAPTLADHFARMKSATARARLGNQLFGKSWAEIVPLLAQGSGALKQATEEARKHGLLNDADAAASDRLGDAQRNLGLALQGVGMAIAKKLAPALTPLIEKLGDWVDTNRDAWSTEALARIESLSQAWKDLTEHVGGAGNALLIVAGIIGSLVVAPLISALAQLAAAFISAGVAAGLFSVAALPITGGLALILGAAALLEKFWPQLAAAGNAAFDAIDAGITAAGKAVVDAVDGLVAGVRSTFAALVGWLGEQFAALWALFKPTDPALLLIWDAFAKSAKDAFLSILSGIKGLWAGIRSVLPTWLGGTVEAPTAPQLGGIGGTQQAPAPPPMSADPGRREAPGPPPMSPDPARRAPADNGPLPDPGRRGLAAAGAPGAPGTAGTVDVVISAPNQPPGTRIATKTTGKGLRSRADVGYSMPQLQPAAAGAGGAQ